MDKDRKAAFDILIEIEKNDAFSNLAIKNYLARNEVKNPGFVRELVYGVLENRIYFDKIIDTLAAKGIKGIKDKELTILRMGLYQLQNMDVPDYAAINESVNLAKKVCYGKDKFINGMLRSFLKRRDEDFSGGDLAVKYSFMPWIANLWKEQGYELEELLKASNTKPKLCLRVNTNRASAEELLEKFDGRKSELSPRAILVKGSDILNSEDFLCGKFSVQDETSIVCADIVDPKEGESVLDMCAAPGGKTMAMAESLKGGDVLAMDIYEHKLALIEDQAKRLGLDNVRTRCQDATKLVEEFIGKFDKVLADVPCSGLGVIRHKPEIKLKEQKDLDKLYDVQASILLNASKYVKKGGSLVYSTCTINKRENEEQIEKFLENNRDYELEFEKQYLPHVDHTDGFYIAKLIHK